MPYTLAHPAAALPFWHLSKRRLRLAALVIGAASPDLVFFLPGTGWGKISHSPAGLLFICLPLSWLGLYLFDRWGRKGVQALLPPSWRLPAALESCRPLATTSAAILLGALTHVIWDSFTHRTGWVVQAIPALAMPVGLGLFPAAPLYRILQHVSTIAGLLILIWPCWKWMRRQPPISWIELGTRLLLFGSFLGAVGILNGLRFVDRGVGVFLAAGGVGVSFGLSLAFLLLGWRQAHASRERATFESTG